MIKPNIYYVIRDRDKDFIWIDRLFSERSEALSFIQRSCRKIKNKKEKELIRHSLLIKMVILDEIEE